MERNGKRILICDCEGTMPLDGKALARALDGKDLAVNNQLCRAQLDTFRKAGGDGTPLLVACTQEAPLFLETQADPDTAIGFVNIRERAGWSRQAGKAMPKIAALVAEAALDIPPTRGVSLTSEGTLLVIGTDETAIDAARRLAGRLDVTVLLTDGAKAAPPRIMDVPIFTGTVEGAKGHLGAFEVRVAGFAPVAPSSREILDFEAMAQTGTSQCDLILDLRGGTPMFTAPGKRDGYFNPDPGNPALVERAIFDLADLVGEFEKPRYVTYDPGICAHSRNDITGCSNCLDVCPTGAIVADGDHVAIDPYICAGCGSCASVCPTGAATYSLPAGDAVFQRLRTLLGVYLDAGGKDPVILVHDTGFGDDMVHALARHGGGLPANVIPFTVNQVTQVGLDFLLAAAAYGAARVCLLVSPEKGDDAAPLAAQATLAETILDGLGYAGGRVILIDDADPEAVEARLYGLESLPATGRGDFLPMGNKRAIMGLALARLHQNAPAPVETLTLPAGAPFGAVDIDVAGCTLCLSCVGACPTGALKDNPDKPQLSFREESCIQCGLCKATCPEKVIALAPRLSFAAAVRDHAVVKEEEPFQCVRCGKPFGAKSTIERMLDKLSGHSMFQGSDRLELIKMCDDCRILVQAEDPNQPLAGAPRPAIRTTEDYLREREELRQQAKKAMEGMESEKKTET